MTKTAKNASPVNKPQDRKRGRPLGSKNTPRERPSGAPLTIADFCQKYSISRATLYRHLPNLRLIRFGRRVLIPENEADRYVASLVHEPSAQRPPEARP